MLEKFERIKLGHFPTPIEHLKNISKYLGGPNIFIKRDDCTGLATGGNKTRKLEFLIPDAIKNKAELVVTVGAIQSNHARQTAAACALMGLKCLIILEQRLKNPPESYMNSGNVFLDKLFGADVRICPKNQDVTEYSEKLISNLKLKGTNKDKTFIRTANRNTEYVIQVLGNKSVTAYSSSEAAEFRDWLINKGMGKSTVKRVFSSIRSIINLTITEKGLEGTNGFLGTFIPDALKEKKRKPIPTHIIKDIQNGFQLNNHLIIEDREIALKHAIEILDDNSILMILGKGRENYQIENGEKVYHNDVEIVEKLINEI